MMLTVPCACSRAKGCCIRLAMAVLALTVLKLGAVQVWLLLVFLQ